jgi:hypothetical protein
MTSQTFYQVDRLEQLVACSVSSTNQTSQIRFSSKIHGSGFYSIMFHISWILGVSELDIVYVQPRVLPQASCSCPKLARRRRRY